MKRKSPVVNLKDFLQRAAAKKKLTENQTENQENQLVLFQGKDDSGSGTSMPEPERAASIEPEIGEISEGDESSDNDEYDDDGIYDIEHDPGLRTPISGYDVNGQDSVRRAYIALGPCRPKMKKNDFPPT